MDQKSALQTEQLKLLLSRSNASLFASTFLAGLLAYMQYGVIAHEVVVTWFGLMAVIAISRYMLAAAYKRSTSSDANATYSRLMWFRTGVLISGFVWGAAGYFLYPDHDADHQMFLIFMITGLTAGAVVSYSAELVSALGFCILVLVPIIVRLFIVGNGVSIAMDVAALIYLGFMFITLRYISQNITENITLHFKGIERELLINESRERYRVLVEWTPEAIIVHRHGKIIYVNPAGIKLFGANSAQEMMSKPVLEFIHPDYRQIVLDRIRQNAIDGLSAPMIEEKFLKMDGTVIDVEVQGTSIVYDGEPAVHAALHDITERKRAESALQYSEQRFRDVSEAAGEYVWEIDANMVYTYVSHQSLLVKGYPPHELLGHTPMEFMPEDDIAGVVEIVNRAIANKAHFRLQHRDITHSGSILWEEVNGVTFYDETGAVIGLRGTGLNITESKLAEEHLRVAAVAFETHEAIMITDINANIIRVNQAFQNITGYSAEEVIGKNPRILSSGKEDKEFFKDMWQQLMVRGNWSGEIWDKRKSGQIFPKWMTISAVKNDTGKTTEFVAIFNDITSRKQADEEIRNLAYYDALTRLPNRRLLMDRLRSAISTSVRSNHYGALLFLDMDRFKTLNDTLGHDYGDLLLIEVAKRIQDCVREIDTVARLGGDEFVILLEEVDAHPEEASRKVALIAEKIRVALTIPYQLSDNLQHSSPSIGVCLYRGNDETVDALLKYADMAMYQVKDAGRNAVRFFDPAMQLAVETRAAMEADLRHAVPKQELQLHYQIQMDNDLRPIGAEALVRWMHPKRGMVSPMHFVSIAEESSLILDIGKWVLDTACRQLSAWSKAELTSHLTLAVNVSGRQFKEPDFVEKVASVLLAYDVDATRLKLELTESVVLNDVTDVISKMHALKALRVRLSMDDFGTGYSSLSYLKQLPLDQIKIDQSFVRDMTSDQNDAVMVQTIIDMAKNFRLNVIAEGVETKAQQLLLKQMGCKAYQGYLFSKPVPIEQFEALL